MKSNNVVLNARISIEMKEALRRIVEKGLYVNESDFVREAIREKLKEMGFTISVISPLTQQAKAADVDE